MAFSLQHEIKARFSEPTHGKIVFPFPQKPSPLFVSFTFKSSTLFRMPLSSLRAWMFRYAILITTWECFRFHFRNDACFIISNAKVGSYEPPVQLSPLPIPFHRLRRAVILSGKASIGGLPIAPHLWSTPSHHRRLRHSKWVIQPHQSHCDWNRANSSLS